MMCFCIVYFSFISRKVSGPAATNPPQRSWGTQSADNELLATEMLTQGLGSRHRRQRQDGEESTHVPHPSPARYAHSVVRAPHRSSPRSTGQTTLSLGNLLRPWRGTPT